jgi:3',5'-cyclic AMP phosphodiesterase CpdA
MKIVHFSDIHAGGVINGLGSLFDKRLLGMGNHVFRRMWKRNWDRVERGVSLIRAMDPDVVICTGDLSTLSEPSEFSMAMDALKPLVEDTRFEFLVVPGNHDHYVKSKGCQRALDGAMRYLSRDRWGLDDLPMVTVVDTVRFIMINQACPVSLWLSSGRLSEETLEFLATELTPDSTAPTFLVNHFPILKGDGFELSWRRGCVNNEPLRVALGNGAIDVALCGHIHKPFARKDESGSIEICAGSLSYHGKMNRIDYQPTTKEFVQTWIDVDDHDSVAESPASVTVCSS